MAKIDKKIPSSINESRLNGLSTAAEQRISFETGEVGKTHQYDYWVDKIEAFFDIETPITKRRNCAFNGSMSLLHLDDVIFGKVKSDEQLFTRSDTRIARDGLDHFIVQVFLDGGGPIDGGHVVQKGDVLVIDMGRAHARESHAFEHLSFVVPRDRDRNLTCMLERFHESCLPAAHPISKLILTQMDQLWSYQSDMTLAQSKLVIDSTLSLIAGVFADQRPLTSHNHVLASASVAQAIRSYIEDNLGAMLGTESICSAFGISRAQLYRLFSEDGGVMRYIQERRLQRAYSLLTRSGPASSKIMAIGESVGFKSDSHFSNSVKQRFGFSPTDLRNCALPRPMEGSSKRFMIDAWLQSLRQ